LWEDEEDVPVVLVPDVPLVVPVVPVVPDVPLVTPVVPEEVPPVLVL